MSLSYGSAVILRIATIGLSSLGYTIQRKSYIVQAEKVPADRKPACKVPLWHLGFWTYIIFSIVGDVFSIGNLPVLVVAPLGTFMLLFNVLFAHFILLERMGKKGIVGTIVIALASCSIAMLLNVPQGKKDSKELLRLLLQPGHLVFSSATLVVFLVVTFIGIHQLRNLKQVEKDLSHEEEVTEITDGANTQDGANRQDGANEEKINQQLRNRYGFRVALSFAIGSSITAVQALIFAKICFDLIHISFATGNNMFTDAVSIIVACIASVTTIVQLYLFNLSLKYYTTVITVPIGYALGIVLACVNTVVYFDSFDTLEAWKIVFVIVSLLAVIFGIHLITRKEDP